jgi:hypothetical protein
MEMNVMKQLTDKDLMGSLEAVVRQERANVAHSIRLIGEIVRRDLHTRLGYSSVYGMLTQRFRMSESCASKRAAAVAAARRYGDVLGLVESGALNLSNLSLIARRMNDENHARLVEAACRLTHRELEEWLVRDEGQVVPRRESVRVVALPLTPRATSGDVGGLRGLSTETNTGAPRGVSAAMETLHRREVPHCGETPRRGDAKGSGCSGEASGEASVEASVKNAEVETGLRLSIVLEGDAKRAFEALRRQYPGKSVTEIVAEAIVAQQKRVSPAARAAAPARKGTGRQGEANGATESPSRYVPKGVRHEVFTRDGGRCTYVAPDGRRCDCEVGLEYDHIRPFARGGMTVADNLRILCKAHNLLAAKDLMGKRFVEAYGERG